MLIIKLKNFLNEYINSFSGLIFSDVINNAMILSGKENSDLYTKIMGIQNELQMAVDRAGFSDQILIIAKKK